MNTEMTASIELPRYKCFKEVWALKIKAIEHITGVGCGSNEANIICGEPESNHTPERAKGDVGMDHNFVLGTFDVANGANITPEESGYAPFHVSQEYLDKHNPQVGGYYVVYKDGYKSFSPAQAFEEGYTKK